MDPEVAQMSAQLAEVAGRNMVGAVTDKIRAVKARKNDRETIEVLDEIVNELLSDKNSLTRIAQAYEDQLVGQRISTEDIEYVTGNLVPLIRQLIEWSTSEGGSTPSPDRMVEMIASVLSVEAVTILQLIGFNFKKAIGEPLTALVASAIASRSSAAPQSETELQELTLKHQTALFEVMSDPDATARLQGYLSAGS
jgi:hypothetical protein